MRGAILASDGTVLARTDVDDEGNETRVYPYDSLFAQVVGYSDYGTSGLESTENYVLLNSHADLTEQLQNDLNGEKNIGDNVVTSLNVTPVFYTHLDVYKRQAIQALTALGYSAAEAMQAVKKVEGAEQMDTEALLKAALKFIF